MGGTQSGWVYIPCSGARTIWQCLARMTCTPDIQGHPCQMMSNGPCTRTGYINPHN